MHEKKNQELNQELNEEMSLEDLQETSGGNRKGHCGFTDETGHCGFTCESDGSYDGSMIVNCIHCPECWSSSVYYEFSADNDNKKYYYPDTPFEGAKLSASCNHCGNSWKTVVHYAITDL